MTYLSVRERVLIKQITSGPERNLKKIVINRNLTVKMMRMIVHRNPQMLQYMRGIERVKYESVIFDAVRANYHMYRHVSRFMNGRKERVHRKLIDINWRIAQYINKPKMFKRAMKRSTKSEAIMITSNEDIDIDLFKVVRDNPAYINEIYNPSAELVKYAVKHATKDIISYMDIAYITREIVEIQFEVCLVQDFLSYTTPEFLRDLFKRKPNMLDTVQHLAYIPEYLFIIALEANPDNIRRINQLWMFERSEHTQELTGLVDYAVKLKWSVIAYADSFSKYLSYSTLCYVFAKSHHALFLLIGRKSLSYDLITRAMCEPKALIQIICKEYPRDLICTILSRRGDYFNYFPNDCKNVFYLAVAAKQYPQILVRNVVNETIALNVLRVDPTHFKYMMHPLARTHNVCMYAVSLYPRNLEFMNAREQTQAIVDAALSANIQVFVNIRMPSHKSFMYLPPYTSMRRELALNNFRQHNFDRCNSETKKNIVINYKYGYLRSFVIQKCINVMFKKYMGDIDAVSQNVICANIMIRV